MARKVDRVVARTKDAELLQRAGLVRKTGRVIGQGLGHVVARGTAGARREAHQAAKHAHADAVSVEHIPHAAPVDAAGVLAEADQSVLCRRQAGVQRRPHDPGRDHAPGFGLRRIEAGDARAHKGALFEHARKGRQLAFRHKAPQKVLFGFVELNEEHRKRGLALLDHREGCEYSRLSALRR